MKKKLLIFICALIFVSCTTSIHGDLDLVVNGVFDAGSLGVGEVKILEGEWIFIPNSFVNPFEDFANYKRFEKINLSWHQYEDELPVYGYGTYAVKIKNLSPDGVYGIKLSTVSSAFIAYIDGKEIHRSGNVGNSYQHEVFNWEASSFPFSSSEKKEVWLVFHVSNFNDNKSGFLKPIEFGFYSTILDARSRSVLLLTILSGILLLTAAFFISLFIFYPKEKQSLYFGLLAANFCLRILCYDEFLLTTIIPQLSAIALFKIGYITFSLGIIFTSLFVNNLFGKLKKEYLFILCIPAIVYIIINIIAPIKITASLLKIAQLYVLIFGIYNLLVVLMAAVRKDKSAFLFLASFFLFLILSIRDILISNRLITGFFVSHVGVLVLIIPMAIIVLRNFRNSFDSVTRIAQKIEATNQALAKFVPNEFMNFLSKKHVDVKLGDNILKDMYIAFIHLGVYTGLETEEKRLGLLTLYNHALSSINPVIEKYKGFIDKYLIEGLMVLFYGSADEVIQCMLEIQAIIKQENDDRKNNNISKIDLAVGVHYGNIMLGTIGEKERMDSTVISDVVNVASRLHFYALKQGVEIFISEEVKKRVQNLSNQTEFKYGGLVRFRGKDDPIRIYEVKKV